MVDSASLDADLQQPGVTHCAQGDAEANRRIAMRLDEIEAGHDFVLLLGDATPTTWTHRCGRHCDELLLLANADQPPRVHAIEEECLLRRPPRTEAAEILVLLQAADRLSPRGTREWLARRPLADHVHIRPALARDMARLARLQSRTAVGMVLAGGGARGFAHLGVYRALLEHGIEVDVVGGTSIGAVMAACVACDQPLEAITAHARKAFSAHPTGDFNLLPMVSLIKGQRLRRMLGQAVHELLGVDADVEDLWKNFYCVATNYSRASEHVVHHGNLVRALLSSTAIPGALPPVIDDGDLLCDGGTFNNFPVDVMRRMRGVGKVIGVDLNFAQAHAHRARRRARNLGAAARSPAPAQAATLPAAVAAGLPDERDHPLQHVAPARSEEADRPLLQSAARPGRHAGLGSLRRGRAAGIRTCARGAGPDAGAGLGRARCGAGRRGRQHC